MLFDGKMAFLSHFSCECPDGKFGVTCDEESSACTTGRHNCAEGSECTVMKDGSYECLCPLGTYIFFMKFSRKEEIILHLD